MLGRMMLASLAARRARLGLALIAVTLGVSVAVALATLSLQVGDDLARTLRAAGPNFVILPAGASAGLDLGGAPIEPARAGLALPETATGRLKSSFWKNNVLDAAPELGVDVEIGGVATRLTGTWFDREFETDDGPWRTGLARLRPGWRIEGRWPEDGASQLALGRELATTLGVAPGGRVSVRHGTHEEPWIVTGVDVDASTEAPSLSCRRHGRSSLARTQRTRCPGTSPTATLGMGTGSHRVGTTCAHRAAKTQPGGRMPLASSWPGIGTRGACRLSRPSAGSQSSSPRV